MSQHARPRVEPAFGWLKTIAWMRNVKLRGLPKVEALRLRQRRVQPDSLAEAAAAGVTRETCPRSPIRGRPHDTSNAYVSIWTSDLPTRNQWNSSSSTVF